MILNVVAATLAVTSVTSTTCLRSFYANYKQFKNQFHGEKKIFIKKTFKSYILVYKSTYPLNFRANANVGLGDFGSFNAGGK